MRKSSWNQVSFSDSKGQLAPSTPQTGQASGLACSYRTVMSRRFDSLAKVTEVTCHGEESPSVPEKIANCSMTISFGPVTRVRSLKQ